MVGPDSSWNGGSVHVVTDKRQARLLANSKSKRLLAPFVARERTISEAAEETGMSLGAMYYRVNTFLGAGLLKVAREVERPGRAIKHYRTIADAFFVPFDLTPHADLEERIIAQLEPLWRLVAKSYAKVLQAHDQAGQYMFRGDTGTVWTSPASSRFPDAPSRIAHAGMHDVTLNLTEAQASELIEQLSELSDRYQRLRQQDGSRQFILQSALVPTPEER